MDFARLPLRPARVERCCRTAQVIAEHFVGHRCIGRCALSGLHDHPGHAVAARQMHGGFGGMLSIRVAGGGSAAIAVAEPAGRTGPRAATAAGHDGAPCLAVVQGRRTFWRSRQALRNGRAGESAATSRKGTVASIARATGAIIGASILAARPSFWPETKLSRRPSRSHTSHHTRSFASAGKSRSSSVNSERAVARRTVSMRDTNGSFRGRPDRVSVVRYASILRRCGRGSMPVTARSKRRRSGFNRVRD
jgi:hypothetical protein